ncbi:aminoglycoside phosphotransferase (APT) family kinase protein [Sphingomonas naasensis]|uniref:Phosphotransferase family protein n=1 Tax=Sphingomonas naasensis TaxID=1344951 RepID=A0A4V3QWY0_9SPHN|nr:phosphotransferase family protein [Sphingomonas naasensis]NIJ20109.1 aminoglycoside phosphotransferase (APT) family kinase protein [Sphingomonas naasensis]TGX44262.1 phosphotransferase family protein [Sphingomonas naasensis]
MSDLDEARLGKWLAANVAGFAGPFTVAKFPGGQSNPTYRIDAGGRAWVLRRKPFGPILPSAHAVEREYRLIAALHPTGFPVARPFGLCEDPDVLGAPFYVMEMVAGRTFWDGALPDMAPAGRTAVYEAIVDTLAALHSVDYAAIGLGDYGKPGNYFERQVARWSKQYRMSQTDDMPEVERLIEWLPRTVPAQTRTSIVHGDFRIDNMIFAPEAPEVRAVLDWELSTLGDPLADFSYFLMSWVTAPEGRSGVEGLTGPETGIPTIEAVVARYCAATGRDGVPDLNWYFAYNLFRLTGIVQGIKKRIIDGNASSAEAAKTVERLPGLAAAAWGFAEKAGA